MPEAHVIFALKEKRARLAGDLEVAKRRVIELRTCRCLSADAR
jgi:hypothetical protein